MEMTRSLKAISDETRMKILLLLLHHSYCVRALARKMKISEGAVSQHLKILRDAGFLIAEKKGYFMHYDVNRDVIHELADRIDALTSIERERCTPKEGGCHSSEQEHCHIQKHYCSEKVHVSCHGTDSAKGGDDYEHPGYCHCHESE